MKHWFHKLEADHSAEQVLAGFRACIDALEIKDESYNVILTPSYISIFVRLHHSVNEEDIHIGVNSLGFAGTLAVKS
jgi:ATP adenylyltransferase/5',5'''-P-1,P-4-tetraphosphate phosphorylase II